MTRFFKRMQKKVALPPGTIEYAGAKKTERIILTVIDYDKDTLRDQELTSAEECYPLRDSRTVSWLDITGLHDTETLKQIGDHFGLHPLVMEDIVNTHQRPKIEDYEDYIYIVLKMLYYNKEKNQISSEQISIVLGLHYVLTFQESAGDVFHPVRERIRRSKGRIRGEGPDYLAYALLDAIVDNYFAILETFGEQIDSLEDPLLQHPTPQLLERIHQVKREMIYLRKSTYPLREVIGALERGESKLVRKSTAIFFRDVYDHTIQVIDGVESFRDMTSSLQDLYLSSLSNRMNEVMKVLTIIATIFVPLTFLAGIYGMNFDFMPELKWKWSYLFFWIVTCGIGGLMLGYFRKKKWL